MLEFSDDAQVCTFLEKLAQPFDQDTIDICEDVDHLLMWQYAEVANAHWEGMLLDYLARAVVFLNPEFDDLPKDFEDLIVLAKQYVQTPGNVDKLAANVERRRFLFERSMLPEDACPIPGETKKVEELLEKLASQKILNASRRNALKKMIFYHTLEPGMYEKYCATRHCRTRFAGYH